MLMLERSVRIREVKGSNPSRSTITPRWLSPAGFFFFGAASRRRGPHAGRPVQKASAGQESAGICVLAFCGRQEYTINTYILFQDVSREVSHESIPLQPAASRLRSTLPYGPAKRLHRGACFLRPFRALRPLSSVTAGAGHFCFG